MWVSITPKNRVRLGGSSLMCSWAVQLARVGFGTIERVSSSFSEGVVSLHCGSSDISMVEDAQSLKSGVGRVYKTKTGERG